MEMSSIALYWLLGWNENLHPHHQIFRIRLDSVDIEPVMYSMIILA